MNLFPVIKNKCISYINQNGVICIETQFPMGTDFSEGYAAVCKDKKYGFIDEIGNLAIDFLYEKTGKFSESYCRVLLHSKWGLINRDGHLQISPQFGEMGDCYFERICVQLEPGINTTYIDINGKTVIDNNGATGISNYSEGFVVSRDDIKNLDGFRDMNGNWAIDPQFSSATAFSSGLAGAKKEIKKKIKTGFINKNGDEVLPFIYDTTIPKFSCGLAIACKELKNETLFGAINMQGEWVIQPKLKYLQEFSDGLGMFKATPTSKAGFFDTNGNVVISEKYKNTFPFKNGIARAQDDEGWLYINKKGDEIWRFE